MGKSTLARRLVADAPRLLAFDPQSEHDGLQLDYRAFAAYLETRWWTERWRVTLYEASEAARFAAWAWVVGKWTQGRGLVVLIDEADMMAPPMREPAALRELMARGRHHAIDVVAIARRPAEVSRLITSQAAELYCFRIHEPRDVTFLGGIMGADAKQLPELQPFEYLRWTPAGTTKLQLAVTGAGDGKNLNVLRSSAISEPATHTTDTSSTGGTMGPGGE
jgi:hypothetical protein